VKKAALTGLVTKPPESPRRKRYALNEIASSLSDRKTISMIPHEILRTGDLDRAQEFEDAIAANQLLPRPRSTQLRHLRCLELRAWRGAILGGLCFIVPGLILILGPLAVFLASHPPSGILGSAPVPASGSCGGAACGYWSGAASWNA